MKIALKIAVVACFCLSFVGMAQAQRKYVTSEFTRRIPAHGQGLAWMEPAILDVAQHGIIADLDVYLDITHSEVSDLLIYLESPAGTTIELKDDQLWNSLWGGISRPDMHGTIFDDEAVDSLGDGQPPYAGRFLPANGNSLSVFNGQDAYGLWKLRIYDLALADTGTLDSWQLQIEHTPEPTAMIYLVLGLAGFFRNHRR